MILCHGHEVTLGTDYRELSRLTRQSRLDQEWTGRRPQGPPGTLGGQNREGGAQETELPRSQETPAPGSLRLPPRREPRAAPPARCWVPLGWGGVRLPPCDQEQLSQTTTRDGGRRGDGERGGGARGPGVRLPGGLRALRERPPSRGAEDRVWMPRSRIPAPPPACPPRHSLPAQAEAPRAGSGGRRSAPACPREAASG